ncbi:hypothetical protein [Brachyspira sp.]|uniref:hypothetical protein n=1 Tax=Brachyspira sp. TaxID=1977261 RepID=UPI003D7CB2BB
MSNIKKNFTYLVVGALVMALSISCKSNEEPSGPKAGTNPPAGKYTSKTDRVDGTASSEYANATVTHNGNGCTITGKLQGLKLPTGSETQSTYKAVDFSITVNSWYEGDGYTYASVDDGVLTSPSGRISSIRWGYSDDGTTYIFLGISYYDGFFSSDTLYYGN